jgi:integrase
MKTQTFILMKTKDPKVGAIYEMIYSGGKVLSRRSLKETIPYKFWDKVKKESKETYTNYIRINKTIKERIRSYQVENGTYFNKSENDCFMEFMESHMIKKYENKQSLRKIQTIFNNVKYVMKNHFKSDNLPFHLLRKRGFIEEFKMNMRISIKKNEKYKSNNAWKNYMNVISSFIKEWNISSNTPHPIDPYFFNKNIVKDQSKKARTLTVEELKSFMNYSPIGRTYLNRSAQVDAKNMFTFQYFSGGKRLIDILLLCNTDFKKSHVEIKIKKTKQVATCEYFPEMLECLKLYYPQVYKEVNNSIKLKDVNDDINVFKDLLRFEKIEEIMEYSLEEYMCLLDKLKHENYHTYKKIYPSLESSLNNLREIVMNSFFHEISKLPKHFVFPYLNISDFSQNLDNLNTLTDKQIDILIKARKKYNRHLKQISKNLGITHISSHVARHTIANHLHLQGASINDIQHVLSHSSITTTQIYVHERLSNAKSHIILRKSFEEGFNNNQ